MKIEQKQKFQQITVTFETAEEAEALWACVDNRSMTVDQRIICNELSDWFCQSSQLTEGG